MSVPVDQVHKLSYYIAAKQLTAFPSPDEWNQYAQFGSIDLFNYYNDERDKMLLKVKSGQSLFVPEPLSNFVVLDYPMTSASIASYPPYLSPSIPNDYAYDIAVKFTYGGSYKDVTKITYQKLQNCLQSTIDNPTNSYPVYTEYANNINIYPASVPQPLVMSYFRYPATPYWNYTMVNGVPTYNSSGSTDFEFDVSELLRLTTRILKYMGISIRDQELEQAAMEMIGGAS